MGFIQLCGWLWASHYHSAWPTSQSCEDKRRRGTMYAIQSSLEEGWYGNIINKNINTSNTYFYLQSTSSMSCNEACLNGALVWHGTDLGCCLTRGNLVFFLAWRKSQQAKRQSMWVKNQIRITEWFPTNFFVDIITRDEPIHVYFAIYACFGKVCLGTAPQCAHPDAHKQGRTATSQRRIREQNWEKKEIIYSFDFTHHIPLLTEPKR